MDLISSADVGQASLDRMIRDGVALPLSPGFAAPVDLPVTSGDRAASLMGSPPSHTVVSGLAGLWVHMGGPRPTFLDLVGHRGLHRAPPGVHPPGWMLRFHSGRAAIEPAETLAGTRVASPTRCAIDGLRWGPLDLALSAVLAALRAAVVDRGDMVRLVRAEDPRGIGVRRMRSAWAAIQSVL